MPSQCYTTTVAHDAQPVEVEIRTFPRGYLAANRLFTPLHVARSLGRDQIGFDDRLWELVGDSGSDTDVLAALVYLLIAAPEVISDPEYLYSFFQSSGQFQLSQIASDEDDLASFARYVVDSPIISIEESWPGSKALSQIAGSGGGVGLGVLVATGALSPLALLTVPAGIIVIGAAWSLRGKFGHRVDSAGEIRKYQKLLKKGAITQAQYKTAVENIIAHDTIPGPKTS